MPDSPTEGKSPLPVQRHSYSIRALIIIFFTAAALIFIGLFSLSAYTYRRAIEEREQISNWHLAQLQTAHDLRFLYVEYSQEWKDILLRGHNPDSYHEHLGKFYKLEREINEDVEKLSHELNPENPPIISLKAFETEYFQLGQLYRRALRTFNNSIDKPQIAADEVTRNSDLDPVLRITELINALEKSRQDRFQQITNHIRRAEVIVILAMLLIGTALLFAIYFLANRLIINPVNKSIILAENISNGKLDNIIDHTRMTTESGQLLRSLAHMQTNIKQARQELIAAKEDADRSNVAKSEFLSRMSHELRTPLNAILGFGQLMQYHDEQLGDELMGYAEEITKAGQHLLNLINEILDLARIESDKLHISIEDIELIDVVADCISLTRPLAQQKAVTLINRISDEHSYVVRGDYLRIKQALINLISNAIKYGSAHSKVTLTCHKPSSSHVRIEVTDTGPGIPGDKMHLLFKPFERLDNEDHIEGTGIGLSLTKKLVELMNGEVGAYSELGKGSTFWIKLELSDSSRTGYPVSVPHVLDDTQHAHAGEKKYTLLYVEDNISNMRLVESLLRARPDIELLTAHTGRSGLKLAATSKPDLILLDIQLPEMDGYQVLTALKEDDATSKIPVIAMSANAMKHDIEAGRQAGFLEYLIKPLNVPLFYKQLQKLLPPGESSGDSR